MVLANPRSNHHIHVTLLVFLLLSGLATTALSAAFLVRARDYWGGYFTKPYKLMLSASVVTVVTTLVFLIYNTVGTLYRGLKNSMMVEIAVFDVLLALNLDLGQQPWRSPGCQPFSSSSLAFLIVWSIVHRSGHGEHSIYKSTIKAHYVEGEFKSLTKAGMTNTAPATHPVSTSHSATPVGAPERAHV
ncbi:hypothetical protein QFC20_000696 [Naganishia adeliensis]|uniref:Uncharacterized protein n=1 Tax=Naganishia adeliensis TaxID=92952 RepID=A0ACC2WXZ4_9TREE|nr:hypothetical protein QFC20_000696 [Naganishia adeliensis]